MASNRAPRPHRRHSRKWHITWAALADGEVTNEAALHTMSQRHAAAGRRLLEYSIGTETHATPADARLSKHIHAFLHFSKKVDVTDWRVTTLFDLAGANNRVLHPEVQSVKNTPGDRQRVINYTQKEGKFIESLLAPLYEPEPDADSDEEDGVQDGSDSESAGTEKDGAAKWYNRLNDASNAEEGMEILRMDFPLIYYTQGTRIQPMLERNYIESDASPYVLTDFNVPQLDLSLPVVLHGKSCAGKTSFALAHGTSPLLIDEPDKLKKVTKRHNLLVFDDVDFSMWNPNDAIKLLDIDFERTIRCRYSNAVIPKGMRRIFCTNSALNQYDHIFPSGKNLDQQRAIDRRYRKVPVTVNLFSD